ncbi:MAG: peptidase M75, partial [Bacteroidales bacterium]|nr:peptidase M75 [Bacteroidales bacterium]
MKLHLKKVFIAVLAMGLAGGFSSCKKEKPDEPSGTGSYSEKMQAVADQFVNATVVPTYTKLAEASDRLVEAIATLKAAKTDANVSAACQIFLEAREWWEKSEAFLFGPASDFGIDPHIDSWPLDEDAFNSLMNSPEML